MVVRADEVMIGELFVTADHEIRKVVRVETGSNGCRHVWYQRKSATVPNESFLFAHTQADPPAVEDFVAECDHRLSWTEIHELRARGILNKYE